MTELRATCTATSKRTGKRCKRLPMLGQRTCRAHGGASPRALEAGRRRVLEARIGEELRTLGWEPVTDPVAAYSDLAGQILAFTELAREQVNTLQSWEGEVRAAVRNGDEPAVVVAEETRAVVTVYERGLDRADKILGKMLALGLDERRVRVAEADAQRVLAALFGALGDRELALDPAMQKAIGAAFVQRLQGAPPVAPTGYLRRPIEQGE